MTIRRWHILNHLIAGFGYQSYLEIGVAGGAAFKRIRVPQKTGVDPAFRLWSLLRRDVIKTTSNRYFKKNDRIFDLVFVDGLHHAAQALQDIENALRVLGPNGTVVVHDCLPRTFEQQVVPRQQSSWTGDVWRAFLSVSRSAELETFVLQCETGCGVIRRAGRAGRRDASQMVPDAMSSELTWEEFNARKREWLSIIPEDQIFERLDGLFSAVDIR